MMLRSRLLFAIALVMLLCTATMVRSAIYRDELSLWQDAAVKSPTKARPLTMRGLELQKMFDNDNARKCFERAVELQPDDPDALNNLATIYGRSGERDKALALLRRAVLSAPRNLTFRSNLAMTYYSQGMLDDSAQEYTIISMLEPRSPEAAFARKMLNTIRMAAGN